MTGNTSASGKRCRHQTVEDVSSAGADTMNEFELKRLRRIQRNKQVLADLGLENAAGALLAGNSQQKNQRAAKQQQCRSDKEHAQQRQQLQPMRRSRRLASQPEAGCLQQHWQQELQELGPGGSSRQVGDVQQRRACSSAAVSQLDGSAHHQHNVHRLNSMSEKALIVRAWKITNVSKLKSFVQVLEAAGMQSVLQEARAALQQLTGSCSP